MSDTLIHAQIVGYLYEVNPPKSEQFSFDIKRHRL